MVARNEKDVVEEKKNAIINGGPQDTEDNL